MEYSPYTNLKVSNLKSLSMELTASKGSGGVDPYENPLQ